MSLEQLSAGSSFGQSLRHVGTTDFSQPPYFPPPYSLAPPPAPSQQTLVDFGHVHQQHGSVPGADGYSQLTHMQSHGYIAPPHSLSQHTPYERHHLLATADPLHQRGFGLTPYDVRRGMELGGVMSRTDMLLQSRPNPQELQDTLLALPPPFARSMTHFDDAHPPVSVTHS